VKKRVGVGEIEGNGVCCVCKTNMIERILQCCTCYIAEEIKFKRDYGQAIDDQRGKRYEGT
jgi:hypothetical protein